VDTSCRWECSVAFANGRRARPHAANKMHGTEACGQYFRCHAPRHMRSVYTRRVSPLFVVNGLSGPCRKLPNVPAKALWTRHLVLAVQHQLKGCSGD